MSATSNYTLSMVEIHTKAPENLLFHLHHEISFASFFARFFMLSHKLIDAHRNPRHKERKSDHKYEFETKLKLKMLKNK